MQPLSSQTPKNMCIWLVQLHLLSDVVLSISAQFCGLYTMLLVDSSCKLKLLLTVNIKVWLSVCLCIFFYTIWQNQCCNCLQWSALLCVLFLWLSDILICCYSICHWITVDVINTVRSTTLTRLQRYIHTTQACFLHAIFVNIWLLSVKFKLLKQC